MKYTKCLSYSPSLYSTQMVSPFVNSRISANPDKLGGLSWNGEILVKGIDCFSIVISWTDINPPVYFCLFIFHGWVFIQIITSNSSFQCVFFYHFSSPFLYFLVLVLRKQIPCGLISGLRHYDYAHTDCHIL